METLLDSRDKHILAQLSKASKKGRGSARERKRERGRGGERERGGLEWKGANYPASTADSSGCVLDLGGPGCISRSTLPLRFRVLENRSSCGGRTLRCKFKSRREEAFECDDVISVLEQIPGRHEVPDSRHTGPLSSTPARARVGLC